MKVRFDGYEIDDSKRALQFPALRRWLSRTYWSPRIRELEIRQGVRHSTLAVGCYKNGKQVGFLRVCSDRTRFAYIMDVYVDARHRGKGVATRMMRFALDHPRLQDVYMWLLATRDAHAVYAGTGFAPLEDPKMWMVRRKRKVRP
jgi:GNAT superfamily N-acetyltransferase